PRNRKSAIAVSSSITKMRMPMRLAAADLLNGLRPYDFHKLKLVVFDWAYVWRIDLFRRPSLNGTGVASLDALFERPGRRLKFYIDGDNLRTVHRFSRGNFLVILVADLGLTGHHQADLGAVHAGKPCALVADDLAVLVDVHVFAEIIDVEGVLIDGVV